MADIDFPQDIRRYPEFIKLMADDEFCAQLWTAFANVDWYKKFDPLLSDTEQVLDILTDDDSRKWGASFRGMAGVIADIRNEYHNTSEDYMDWYCSNYRSDTPFGHVSEAVATALAAIGWFPIKDHSYMMSNTK